MPKQSGIHQIRGKYGTTCYYFRKGGQNGLQRGINQQMSERVKRDPNFANTRLYASEFGYSGHLAALSFVPTEFGLTLNLRANSQGKLTSIYRNLLNEYGIGNFGKRNFIGTEWQPLFAARINDMGRKPLVDIYPIECQIKMLPTDIEKHYRVTATYTWTPQLVQKMHQYGISQLNIVVQHFVLCAGHYSAETGSYVNIGHLGGSYSFEYVLPIAYAESHSTYTQTISNAIIDYPTDLAQRIEGGDSILSRPVIYVQGMREVGGTLYKQQIYSAFRMLDNAELVTNAIDHIEYNGVAYRVGDTGPVIDLDTSDEILIVSDYMRSFPSKDGFSARANAVDSFVFLLTGNTLNISAPATIDGDRLRTVGVTYPDGSTASLRLN